MTDHVMPSMPSARTYKTAFISQMAGIEALNKINGVWARLNGDSIDYGLSPMIAFIPTTDQVAEQGGPAAGDFVPNPFGDELLDSALARLVAADTPSSDNDSPDT